MKLDLARATAAPLRHNTLQAVGEAGEQSAPTPEADAALQALNRRLAGVIQRRARTGGLEELPELPDVRLFTSTGLHGLQCAVYQPSVALIAQGNKRVVVGDETLHYGPGRLLLASLDLPATATILDASPEQPYLSVALMLDLHEAAGLMLEVPPLAAPPHASQRAIATGAVDAPLLDAFCRLLELPDRPGEAALLGPLVRREIVYRLLAGEHGWRLRQIVHHAGQGRLIARAISVMRERFREPLRMEDLARDVQMSLSTFHHHFKALTAMSPLQFQKQLRLAEARRLMLAEDLDAASAAYRVGYESASQFSREYSRHFGAPPARDIAGLRAMV